MVGIKGTSWKTHDFVTVTVKCVNCGRVWDYRSKYRKWYTKCPDCFKTIRIRELVLHVLGEK